MRYSRVSMENRIVSLNRFSSRSILTDCTAHAILVGLISRNANDVGTRAVSAAVYNMCYQFGSIIAVNVYRNDDKPYCKSRGLLRASLNRQD